MQGISGGGGEVENVASARAARRAWQREGWRRQRVVYDGRRALGRRGAGRRTAGALRSGMRTSRARITIPVGKFRHHLRVGSIGRCGEM